MSQKEWCVKAIESLSEEQAGPIMLFMKSYLQNLEEAADDAFCRSLAESYDESTDHQTVSFDEALATLGLTKDDLAN